MTRPSLTETLPPWLHRTLVALSTILLVYAIILSVGLVGDGFKLASGGEGTTRRLLQGVAGNPFMALFVATFATALVQSSSTVTSIIVGLVAGGAFTPTEAVPMIMGANIGTTVTNTLVSLSHMTRPQEFRRAFAAATVHDMFNLLAVAIFLPLELMTGVLGRSAEFLARNGAGQGMAFFDPIKHITKPVMGAVYGLLKPLGDLAAGLLGTLLAVLLLFFAIYYLGKILRANLQGRAEQVFHAAVGRGPIAGITSGCVITMLVQSSSTTTSLIVPMAGAGVLTLDKVYPFTLGANIGTCITAIIAAAAGSITGLVIALVHLLFNVFGTLLIYGVPFLRRIPMMGAEWLAALAVKNRFAAFAYIGGVFFLLPLLLILVTESLK